MEPWVRACTCTMGAGSTALFLLRRQEIKSEAYLTATLTARSFERLDSRDKTSAGSLLLPPQGACSAVRGATSVPAVLPRLLAGVLLLLPPGALLKVVVQSSKVVAPPLTCSTDMLHASEDHQHTNRCTHAPAAACSLPDRGGSTATKICSHHIISPPYRSHSSQLRSLACDARSAVCWGYATPCTPSCHGLKHY